MYICMHQFENVTCFTKLNLPDSKLSNTLGKSLLKKNKHSPERTEAHHIVHQ